MARHSNHAVIAPPATRLVYERMIYHSARWRTFVQTLPGHSAKAPSFVEDLFCALYASDVRLNEAVHPAFYRNFAVLAGLLPMPDFARLQRETAGDAIASAMAVGRLAPELLAAIEGDGDEEVENGGLLHRLTRAAAGRFRRSRASERQRSSVDGPRGQEPEREHSVGGIKPAAVQVLARALEETVGDDRLRRAWGIEPGVRSVHGLDDVWALLDAVRKLPGFEQLTDALTEMVAALQPATRGRGHRRRGRSPRFEQLLGWTRGRDVDRVVPEEWVRLLDEDMTLLFHEAYEHGRLVQEHYGMKGPDRPGPFIVCLDVSRSMNVAAAGGRERFVWAKGIGLALMHVARRTERPFLGICFSSEEDVASFEVGPGERRPQVAIDMARCDFDGGTHFQAPLRKAITYLEEGQGAVAGSEGTAPTADGRRDPGHIVFVTDGEAALPPPFVQYVHESRQRLGFRLITIFIDGGQVELEHMSDRVFQVQGNRMASWERAASGLARMLAQSV